MSTALDQGRQVAVSSPAVEVRPSTGYRYTIHRQIRDVDPDVWNSLRRANRDPFMDPCFLEAVEVGMAAVSKFWHVVFYDEANRPAAIARLCSYRVDAALLAEGILKQIALAVGRVLPRLLEFRVMFCGLCFSAGQSHLRFAPGVDTAVILRQLDELLLSLGRQEKAKCIVFKEFKPQECQDLDALLPLGYQRADSLPMNHVEPIFRDFNDYCAKQKSSRRYAIRKAQKKFAASGLKVVQMLGGEGADRIFTDDVYRLFENVFDRAKVRLEKVTADVFRELARKLPENTAYTFIYDQDRVVAFAVSLFTPAVYHQMFVGYDAALNPEYDVYFNLFFHAIDRAYRQNVGVIHVGQSADEFKHQKLGCHQRPLYFYIKGIDWTTRHVLERFGRSMFPPRFVPSAIPPAAEPADVTPAE
ncbi:MAG TPA: GNAT family N-acetyltransferase [Planctomycetaceae bacterium]|nr:GNAT family N-acetyltransferase [Planctomycetaceae bacterium]